MKTNHYRATILFHYWKIRRGLGHIIKRKGLVPLPPELTEQKTVFFHIPKTAGKSLATAVFGTDINHFSYQQVAKQISLEDYYTFTFVRNPWDRMVSAYKFLQRGGWGKVDHLWCESRFRYLQNFSDFLRYVERHPYEMVHFLPQTYWVYDKNKQINLNFIGKFEYLQHDYNELCKQLSINTPLPHMNPSKRHKKYQDYYKHHRDIEIVCKLFHDDIREFDYKYE